MDLKFDTLTRFFDRVDTSGDCWLWRGGLRATGYGQLGFAGKNWTPHRFYWTVLHGPIPPGLILLHTCDVRGCIRDEHLVLGTQRDNVRDMVAKGRHRSSHGLANGKAKISDADVGKLRALRSQGWQGKPLARRFGVSESLVYMICNGRRRVAPSAPAYA